MPDVPKASVIAVLCSDIHLSARPPVYRSNEPDWYAAMARPLNEIKTIANHYDVPVICAGDIFDKWLVPPELINFAIAHIDNWYAIPGQHDLPYHSYEQIEKSGYWTLVAAGAVQALAPGIGRSVGEMCMYGYPWGFPIKECPDGPNLACRLAVCHKYIWKDGTEFRGAARTGHIDAFADVLKTYDAAVFGDNHVGFVARPVFNCGTLMRRKADEATYQPQIGLLLRSGVVMPHYLDTSKDHYLALAEDAPEGKVILELADFIQQLSSLSSGAVDFSDAVTAYCERNELTDTAKHILLASITNEVR